MANGLYHRLKIPSAVCIIIVMFSVSLVQAQVPQSFGMKYKVKKSDEMSYKLTKFISKFITPVSFITENGTNIPFNLSIGDVTTCTVVNKTPSKDSLGGYIIYYQLSKIFNKTSYKSPISAIFDFRPIFTSFINPVFDNVSILKAFLQNYFSRNPNSSTVFHTYEINGDTFTVETNNSANNQIYFLQNRINWKTGWLISYENIQKANNGTVLYDYKLDQISATNQSSIFDSFIFVLALITIPFLFVVGSYLGLRYNKKKRNS